VGCTTPPTPDPDPDPTPTPVVVVSATPVLTAVETSAAVSIFDVTSTSTLYMNKAEAGSSILVKGTAPAESRVQIYVDDATVAASVVEATASGLFTVAVAKVALGTDGVKTLHVTATEVGLAESAASNVATFTLDTDLPGISSIAATASAGFTAVSGTITGTIPINTLDRTSTTVVAGSWTILCLGDSGDSSNVRITPTDGTATTYSVLSGGTLSDIVTGYVITFVANFKAGDGCKVTTTAAITARAKIVFDEAVDYTGMAAGTYNTGDPTTYKDATYTGYWESPTPAVGATAGGSYTITVYGVTDLAGNADGGTSASPLSASCTIGAASATTLKP